MKTKFLIIIGIIGILMFSSAIAALENVSYPVGELGGCKSESDCKIYCDKPENGDACLNFAQENNIMSKQEVKIAKQFLKMQADGPGGCKDKDSCEEYCNDMSHIDACISFAEKNNLMPPAELEEAKKVQSAIARGVKVPSCGNKKACDVYCEDSNHMEECITFGIEAGFIQGKELEDVQKMLQAIKRGVKPPPCKGKEACDEYCSSPDNMEVCMNFAMEAGFMSEQEKADSQKMLQAIKRGVKPPPCKGKNECDAYCTSEGHMEECINFSIAAGMMSEEDAKMARKTGGKGPGGCKGKDECENFCNNPDSQETCFNFAKDNGMIPEEDLKQMEEGKQKMKESLGQAPSEVLNCLTIEFGADMVEKMKNGFMPPRESGDKMQGCFQKMGHPSGQENQNFQPGPGAENPGGQIMPQQAGPGGCKGPEECQKYCENNPEECKNFGPAGQNNQQGQQGPNQMQQCEGENCQQQPPPPSIEQGAGENIAPGDFVPLVQPAEQQPQQQQQPAPSDNPPPPPPPPVSFLEPGSFVGALLYIIAKALYSLR